MWAIAWLLLGAGAGVGIHVEDRENVSDASLSALLGALETNIRARTATITAIDDLDWSSCAKRDRCVDDIRARTGATDVLIVRAFGGPRGVHVIAELLTRTSSASAKLTLARDGEATWRSELEPIVAALFPAARATALAPLPIAAVERSPSPLPWIALGTGAAALGAGLLFGLSSASAARDLESGFHDELAYRELADRQHAHGLAANILFAGAIAAAATAGFLLIFDDQ